MPLWRVFCFLYTAEITRHMENYCKYVLRVRLTQYMNSHQYDHVISSEGITDTALQDIITNY